MGFRINRGVFQFKDGETFRNKFKIDTDGQMVEVDGDGNAVAPYMRFGDKAHDADFLDGIDSSNFIRTTNNSTLNSDTRNTRGVTRLYRNDSDSNYNVQTYWTGAHWFLRGYSGDTFHAEVRVGKADSADNATNASYLTGGDTSFRGLLYHSLNGDLNQYNVAGLYSAEYVGGTNIPLDQRGHFIQISDAGGTDVKTQWYYQSNGEKIHMRLMWGAQNWFEWRELITDSNIGSQSVNYAASAGNADTVDGYHANNSGGGIPVLNSNGYWDAPSWINVRGTGLYSSTTNGAHFVPNGESYGSWQITGTRNGWYGIHFGASTGVALMMNESESGVHRQGSGWKYRHHNGKFYVYTGTNGGGTGYGVWHEGNDGSGSGLDADLLDGYHSNQLGNRDFTKQGFHVDGDENTYYPVVIGNGRGRYGFNRYSITRHYSSTAPWDPIGTGSHKGGLTFDFYWSGDTNWGGNHKPFRVHEFGENYTTMVGGIALARTGGMVVWLRGGHAYYELHCDALPPSITVYLEGFTDGSGGVYDPTDDVNQHKDTIWNNYPVRNGSSLYIGNRAVATEQWTDDTFLRTTEKAADSNLLDGIDSGSFLRSDAADTASSRIDFTADESIRLKGIRGQFTGEYMHLYNKVGIGHPSGWGQGNSDTPNHGLSTYGGANFAYGNGATSSFKGHLRVDKNWGEGDFAAEAFTIRGSYPSITLRSTNQNNKWLIHNDGDVSFYYGAGTDNNSWSRRFTIPQDGNIWMSWAGDYISNLLAAKETAGAAGTVETALNARIEEEILPAIDGKLDATAKAADSNLLDGYDWMQSGKSVRANEFYADNWFRSYNSGEGIYNEATGQHWYSDSSSRWRMRSGNGSEAWMMLCTSDNTTRGSFYANNSNEVGILDQGNAWAIKHVNDSGTYFYTDNTTEEFKVGRDVVSGSYGTVQTSTTRSGWGGYSINGAYVFMSDHSSTCGIFNDIDNEWMAIFRRNAEVELMYNGAMKLETTSTGVSVSGNVNASAFIGSLDWSNVTNKPVIPAATEPVQATVEGGEDSTLSSISFSPGEGVATFTLADGQTFRLAFAR